MNKRNNMKTDKIIVILMVLIAILFSLILCTQIVNHSGDTIKKETDTSNTIGVVTTDDGLHWETEEITTFLEINTLYPEDTKTDGIKQTTISNTESVGVDTAVETKNPKETKPPKATDSVTEKPQETVKETYVEIITTEAATEPSITVVEETVAEITTETLETENQEECILILTMRRDSRNILLMPHNSRWCEILNIEPNSNNPFTVIVEFENGIKLQRRYGYYRTLENGYDHFNNAYDGFVWFDFGNVYSDGTQCVNAVGKLVINEKSTTDYTGAVGTITCNNCGVITTLNFQIDNYYGDNSTVVSSAIWAGSETVYDLFG